MCGRTALVQADRYEKKRSPTDSEQNLFLVFNDVLIKIILCPLVSRPEVAYFLPVCGCFAEGQWKSYCNPLTGCMEAMHLLRPNRSSAVEQSGFAKKSAKQHESTSVIPTGNRIANLANLLCLINNVSFAHARFSARCFPGRLLWRNEKLQGCGSTLFLSCDRCDFESIGYPIYKIVEDITQKQTRGQKPCMLNQQLVTAIVCTGVSVKDAQLFCSFLDLPSPSSQALSAMCKKAAEAYHLCNREDMGRIRQSLRQRNVRCGLPIDFPIPVECDCRYNIRTCSSGNAPGQPASQVLGIACENLTPDKKIIAMSHRTKFWKNKQNRLPTDTSQLVPEWEPIGNSEKAIGEDLGEQVMSDGLRVGFVTTDNDSKLFSGIAQGLQQKCTPVKQDCLVHRFRALYKKVKKCKFGTLYQEDATARERAKSITALARETRVRLSAELQGYCKKHNGNPQKVAAAMHQLLNSCLSCFQGDHGECRNSSVICKGTREKTYKAQYLVREKRLQVTEADHKLWKATIAPFFSVQSVARMQIRSSTNKCESVNFTFGRTLPKGMTFRSTLAGRAASAVLQRNNGVQEAARSVMEFWNISLDASSPGKRRLADLQRKQGYRKVRNSSESHRQRKKKCTLSRLRAYRRQNIDTTYVKDIDDVPSNEP